MNEYCDVCYKHDGVHDGDCPVYIKELEEENEELRKDKCNADKKINEMCATDAWKHINKLEAENEKLRKALRFYAERENYIYNYREYGITLYDDGTVALKCLEE